MIRALISAHLHHLTREKFVDVSADRCRNLENVDPRIDVAPLRHLTRARANCYFLRLCVILNSWGFSVLSAGRCRIL